MVCMHVCNVVWLEQGVAPLMWLHVAVITVIIMILDDVLLSRGSLIVRSDFQHIQIYV